MAGELQFSNSAYTGDTLYAMLYNATGSVRDVVAGTWDAFADADVDDYDIALAEQGTSSGFFIGDMPSVGAGVYSFTVRKQSGASPAVSDLDLATGVIQWDGSAEQELYRVPVDVELIEGIDATNQINAEVDTAIVDYGLDHLLAAAVTGTDITDDSIIAQLVSKAATADWDDFDNTTDALQAIKDTIAALNDLAQSDILDDATPFSGADIAAILTDTNELQTDDVPGLIAALNDVSVADILAGTIESTYDLQAVLRIMLAVLAGKSTGGGTTSVAFRDVADTKDRVAATTDVDGNRDSVTLDAS